MNGAPRKIGLPRKMPAIAGERPAPIVRATPVIPAAAERSSGATTAIVYAWRGGTSICEMLNRKSSRPTAHGKLGMNGIRIKRTFDGRWVKTIVFTRPIRAATLTDARAEIPASRFAPKKIDPKVDRSAANLTWNQ